MQEWYLVPIYHGLQLHVYLYDCNNAWCLHEDESSQGQELAVHCTLN